ncbi:DUF4189 domain-containing protein [Nocardia takedensis]
MSVTRTLVFAALTAASLTVLGAQAAHAAGDEYGAIAVEKAAGPLGVTNFYGSWASSPEVARAAVAARCGSATGNPEAVCDLVTWSNACVAAATRGVDYQWAEGPDRATAERNAVNLSNAVGTPGLIPLPAAVGYVLCTPNSQ